MASKEELQKGFDPSNSMSVRKYNLMANAPSVNPVPNAMNNIKGVLNNTVSTVNSAISNLFKDGIPQTQNDTNDTGNYDYNGGISGGYGNISDILKAYQDQYANQLTSQQKAYQQNVQNAYNNNMSALANAYNDRVNRLGDTYNATIEQLGTLHDTSRDNLNANAENALREAYINRMMGERNLRQNLSNQGLTGGASESALASLINNYGNSRYNINADTARNLTELENAYLANIASAKENYSNALNDAQAQNYAYKAQLNNDLANGIVGSYDNMYNGLANAGNSYVNAMTNLAVNQQNADNDMKLAAYKAALSNANKVTANGNVTSSGVSGTATKSNIKNYVITQKNNGASEDEMLKYLTDSGVDRNTIISIMSEVYPD